MTSNPYRAGTKSSPKAAISQGINDSQIHAIRGQANAVLEPELKELSATWTAGKRRIIARKLQRWVHQLNISAALLGDKFQQLTKPQPVPTWIDLPRLELECLAVAMEQELAFLRSRLPDFRVKPEAKASRALARKLGCVPEHTLAVN